MLYTLKTTESVGVREQRLSRPLIIVCSCSGGMPQLVVTAASILGDEVAGGPACRAAGCCLLSAAAAAARERSGHILSGADAVPFLVERPKPRRVW